MNGKAAGKQRAWRLVRAAAPSVGVLCIAVWSALTMAREFTWSGLLLVLLIPPAAVVAVSIMVTRLRTERRLTDVRLVQHQDFRQLLAATPDSMVIAREDNVVFLPLVGRHGVVRIDRDELAEATRDGRPDATVVGERFWLDSHSPQVGHDFTTVTPLADDTTAVAPLARRTSSSFWSPRAWWRDLRTEGAASRSGVTVPSDAELGTLLTQLRAAAP